jgi:hypothetical protein
VLCFACQTGQHEDHVEIVQPSIEGVLGSGSQCLCQGNCEPIPELLSVIARLTEAPAPKTVVGMLSPVKEDLRAELDRQEQERADYYVDLKRRIAGVMKQWGVRSRHTEWTDEEAQVSAAGDVMRELSKELAELRNLRIITAQVRELAREEGFWKGKKHVRIEAPLKSIPGVKVTKSYVDLDDLKQALRMED